MYLLERYSVLSAKVQEMGPLYQSVSSLQHITLRVFFFFINFDFQPWNCVLYWLARISSKIRNIDCLSLFLLLLEGCGHIRSYPSYPFISSSNQYRMPRKRTITDHVACGISQNHRMIEVGKGLWRSCCPRECCPASDSF